ncbi:head-tail connector protein [Pandoraea bronchicola]|uniref:Bacteriophage protein n=1 Tax=Pandoraea bronchicola TaxID=2508287 RepID=A0A5E5BSZ1_9BURK|nr:head-tail connector protein [Pandoraea bronchicola]VVE87563.1 bacteriophage protein [Pandoraea bronchicola]
MAESTPIVSLQLALTHLREDGGVADDLIKLYIGAATQAAVDFLDRQLYADDGEMQDAISNGTAGFNPLVANDAVRAAILLTVGKLYAYREDVVAGTSTSVMELPGGAKALLFPYRTGLGV